MNCNDLEGYLHEFLDDELAADKRNEVANHLASCRHCAVKVAEFEQADRQLSAVKAVAPPADFLLRVRLKIEAEEKAAEKEPAKKGVAAAESLWDQVARSFTFPIWVKVPLAAAAALVLLLALFQAIQPRQTTIPATYQLTRNEVDKAKELDAEVSRKPAALAVDGLHKKIRDEKEAGPEDRPADRDDFVLALPQSETSPVVGEELAKADVPHAPSDPAAESHSAVHPELAFTAPAKTPPEVVGGKAAGGGDGVEFDAANNKLTEKTTPKAELTKKLAGLEAKPRLTNTVPAESVVAAAPPAPPPMMPSPAPTRAAKSARKTPMYSKAEVPSITNQPVGRQAGWLDLSTRTFYLEFGKASAGGAFVRGHLDEKSKFIVTSTEVEGQLVELDARTAALRGTYGWLELSSRNFVPARPGLRPSYPYLEGYQDRQGEFRPTARRIYRAND